MNTRTKSPLQIALITLLCLSMAACTLIRDGDDPVGNGDNNDNNGFVFNDIPVGSTVVDVLILVDLSRGAASLMDGYHTYISLLELALAERDVYIRNLAVAPLYRQQNGRPPLLYGRGSPDNLSPSLEQTLYFFVSDDGLAYLDGRVDIPGENLAALGLGLDQEMIFNPDRPSEQGRAYFAPPEDGFLVFHLTGTERACGHGQAECALEGEAPAQYFTETGGSGLVDWLHLPGATSLAPDEIVHISIATEEGVDYETFVDNCTSEPNFPQTYLDFLAPSGHNYFAPFASHLETHGGAGIYIDLCVAFSSRALTSSLYQANQIAQHLQ